MGGENHTPLNTLGLPLFEQERMHDGRWISHSPEDFGIAPVSDRYCRQRGHHKCK